jgi:hypothetical protein
VGCEIGAGTVTGTATGTVVGGDSCWMAAPPWFPDGWAPLTVVVADAGSVTAGVARVAPTAVTRGRRTWGPEAELCGVFDRPGCAHAASAENNAVAPTDAATTTRVTADTLLSPASRDRIARDAGWRGAGMVKASTSRVRDRFELGKNRARNPEWAPLRLAT